MSYQQKRKISPHQHMKTAGSVDPTVSSYLSVMAQVVIVGSAHKVKGSQGTSRASRLSFDGRETNVTCYHFNFCVGAC
jgi:hypothetical protein